MKNHNNILPSLSSYPLFYKGTVHAHLQKIVDSSLDVICTIDKHGCFVEVSAASVDLWGYTPEELKCKKVLKFVVKEDREKTIIAGESIASGKQVTNFMNRYQCRNGEVIPIVWSARWDQEDEVMYCVARDGREKQMVEQVLHDERKRLIRSQQIARMGSWEYDLRQKITYWSSDELYSIYGLKREEVPEITPGVFMNLVHPEDLEILIQDFSDINRLNNYYREHRIIRPDGTLVYVKQTIEISFDGDEPVRLSGIVQDISDQKASEHLLLASERRYRSLVQNGFDMISILDKEGRYIYASDSTFRVLGHNPGDLLSHNAFDFIHPDDVVKTAKSFALLFKQTYIEDAEPFRIKNSKGEWRWIETKGANMFDDPVIGGFVFNSRDITDKKLLQERIEREAQEWQRKLTAAAITAQELERTQLGRELHDNVNQMLTTVKLYTELCLESDMDTKMLLEKSAHYLSVCINEIRSISKRLSTPTIEDLSLSESVKDLVCSLNLTDKLNIKLDIKRIRRKLSREVHLGIYRIIQEQLTNILKHAAAKNVLIEIHTCANNLIIRVKDDGKGFNLHSKRTGIGINNMYARAENINAELRFKTAPGKSCSMELILPLKQ